MKTWMKMALVTLLFGVPTIPLGRVIWPDPVTVDGLTPIAYQLALLIVISIVESLAFGFGIAFLLFGFSRVQRLAGGSKGWSWAVYLAVAWSLMSWWPHSNMHRVASGYDQLILIEYTFHMTLVICAVIVSLFFMRLLVRAQAVPAPQPEKVPASFR